MAAVRANHLALTDMHFEKHMVQSMQLCITESLCGRLRVRERCIAKLSCGGHECRPIELGEKAPEKIGTELGFNQLQLHIAKS